MDFASTTKVVVNRARLKEILAKSSVIIGHGMYNVIGRRQS